MKKQLARILSIAMVLSLLTIGAMATENPYFDLGGRTVAQENFPYWDDSYDYYTLDVIHMKAGETITFTAPADGYALTCNFKVMLAGDKYYNQSFNDPIFQLEKENFKKGEKFVYAIPTPAVAYAGTALTAQQLSTAKFLVTLDASWVNEDMYTESNELYIVLDQAGAADPAKPVTPSKPADPAKPVAPAAATAKPTASPVLVDGKETAFDAYNIGGNNYFKLRDIAQILRGTGKQFEVTWNSEKAAIDMVSGKAYTSVGGEMTAGDGKDKSCTLNAAPVYKDGTAVTLTAYNIGGNNYFKLRDLGSTFDFDVSWDTAKGTVVVDTAHAYTAD
ncbi:MAG: hypothetical protein RRY97_02180 [Oscillibacter sp.]